MLRDIYHWLEDNAGYRAASSEIANYLVRPHKADEIRGKWKAIFRGRRGELQSPFLRGWSKRWEEFGGNDATRGEWRADWIDYQPYRLGWADKVAEHRKYGWRHSQIEEIFSQLPSRPLWPDK